MRKEEETVRVTSADLGILKGCGIYALTYLSRGIASADMKSEVKKDKRRKKKKVVLYENLRPLREARVEQHSKIEKRAFMEIGRRNMNEKNPSNVMISAWGWNHLEGRANHD
ncbi:flavin-binding monooxygenase family protein [Striga asiatica]|uniref:Flavin-binding monooxygenase family protein n=1 Tax=Striga asiatica TaxID=4170 RepID=A0A5A7QQN2_STRAF|nr:flavin-binding monooxygenase family protein [Striga asiatica]